MSTRVSPLYQAFGKAKQPLGLPAPEPQVIPAPPPPPPPPARPAPPPPPPMPAAHEQIPGATYVPRDPNVYCYAKVLYFAALRPTGNVDKSDRVNAAESADILARFIDSGETPERFDIPEVAAIKALILEKETIVTAPRPNEHFPPNVPHIKRVTDAIDARARELGESIPSDKDELKKTVESVAKRNRDAIAGIGDLSGNIRWAAMVASADSLSKSPLTGSPTHLHDCLRVVYEFLDFAIRAYSPHETDPLPYPGSATMQMVEMIEEARASLADGGNELAGLAASPDGSP